MTNRFAVAIVAVVVAVGLLAGGAAVSSIGGLDAVDPGATSGEVRAVHATMHMDRVGRPTVVGEVVNGKPDALADVSVAVTFFEDGEAVANATGTVVATPVPGRERMPFSVHAGELSERPDGFEVEVTSTATTDRSVYEGFVVTEQRLTEEAQDQLLVNGEVENRGDRPGRVLVVATFFDENGSVVGVRQLRPSPAELEPGGTATFQVRFRTLGNVPSRAREFADFEVRAVRLG